MMRSCLSRLIVKDLIGDIPAKDLSIQAVVSRVEDSRGRGVAVFGMPLGALGLKRYACWVSGKKLDYVCVEWDTASIHRDHCILHELAHMLLGHETLYLGDFSSWLENPLLMRGLEHAVREEVEAERLAINMHQFMIRRIGVKGTDSEWATVLKWEKHIIYGLLR